MKKPFYKRWWFIALVLIVIIGALGGGDDEPEDITKEPTADVTVQPVEDDGEDKEDINYEVTGELSVEFKDNKAIATITTNAIDGTLFETSLMDSNFNTVSDFIEIKDGVGTKEFDIHEEWEVGYKSALSMMRFNLDEHPQPDHVKELYGENGEKLEGKFAEENNLGGNNIHLEIITIPYPDLETVSAAQDESFWELLNELRDASNGLILNIQPHLTDNDWSSVAVTVSDAWYYSEEHEKERFAEQVASTISTIVINTGKAEGSARVYFYDEYQKELASPKILGGYKIKR